MSSGMMMAPHGCGECSLRLERLHLWFDPLPRRGYANMAVDELLSAHSEPWLRVYGWAVPAVSYGYFDSACEARRLFPGAEEYIRRWTGGGIVDHRLGQTYTLTLPGGGEPHPSSAQLYLRIHSALAAALAADGVPCRLLREDAPSGGRSCWASPVCSDIVDAAGHKLAGAGQRRHRGAVLHQGLVQQCEPRGEWPLLLARALAEQPLVCREAEPWDGFDSALASLLENRYLRPEWEDEHRGCRYHS